MFSFGFEHRRKTVQDQVAIEFTQNAMSKTSHSVLLFQPLYMDIPLDARNIIAHNAARECREAIPPRHKPLLMPDFVQKKDHLPQRTQIQLKAASPQPTVDIAASGVVQA